MGTRGITASTVALGVLLSGPLAHADKFDETLDLSLQLRSSWYEADDLRLKPSPAYDARLIEATTPTLTGVGRSYGGSLRAGFSIDGFRFGIGVGAMSVAGLRLESSSEALSAGRLWALPLEAYAGYAFGSGLEVRPFLEARGTLDLVGADLSVPEYGAPFHVFVPGVALRGGLRVPLGEYFFADAGLGAGVVGPERVTLDVALGIPIPLDNL
jgi:hypothetical protein